ncbi:MAG: (Fe-S)-binding protein, partial [Gemmatimonas sp.]
MLTSMLHSVAILGGVGLVFAVFIALAYWKLRVWEDPRIDVVASMLPGANCGACGLPGCRGFAEQAVAGKIQPAACNVIDAEGASVIASYLGVDAGQGNKKVARLLCAGGSNVAVQLAEYRGLPTCGAATAVAGGGKGCAWGCLGFGDCAVSCTFGAITMNRHGLPVVDVNACTACGDCVTACPKNLFEIIPLDQKLLVQCRSMIEGDEALESCAVACTACGKCVIDAAPGLVTI